MAKGNDGNYLQHAIEVDAAVRLVGTADSGELRVAFTHGMAPFEPTDVYENPPARSNLLSALNRSYLAAVTDESALVSAYRRAHASLQRYPNSGELLRHVIGGDRLSGAITEIEADKYHQLKLAWSGSRVVPVHSSWRSAIGAGEPLACPTDLETPWLVSLDPMTYREDGYSDDPNLYRADLERIKFLVTPYVGTRRPGVVAVFVYAIKPDDRPQFWRFVQELGAGIGAQPRCCWMTHRGGSRNLAGVFPVGFDYPVDQLPQGITPGCA